MHFSGQFKCLLICLNFIGIFLLTNGMMPENKGKDQIIDLETGEIQAAPASPPKVADPLNKEANSPKPIKSSATHASNVLDKLKNEELKIANYISQFLKNPEFIQPSEFHGNVVHVHHVASEPELPPEQHNIHGKTKSYMAVKVGNAQRWMKNYQGKVEDHGGIDNGKWLKSDDQMVGPLMDVVHRLMTLEFPEKYAELRKELEGKMPAGGCRFSFVPDERTFHYAFLFKLATTYSQEEVRNGVKDLKTPDFMKEGYDSPNNP